VAENRYLAGIARGKDRVGMTVVVLWLIFLAFFLVVFQVTSDPGALLWTVWPPLLVGVFGVSMGFTRWRMRTERRSMQAVEHAEQLVLSEQSTEAIALLKGALNGSMGAYSRFRAWTALGKCAEYDKNFHEAVDVYAEAATSLTKAGRAYALLREQLLPLAAAHRAFVLAVTDRIQEAEATLQATSGPRALPGTFGIALRTRLVLLAKRGRRAELLQAIEAERALILSGFTHRDRVFVRALVAWAKGEPARAVTTDAELSAWLSVVLPMAAPYLVTA
jgi:tetratricopeptide (TPR) repeat protein